jgi:hypothetical protein
MDSGFWILPPSSSTSSASMCTSTSTSTIASISTHTHLQTMDFGFCPPLVSFLVEDVQDAHPQHEHVTVGMDEYAAMID